MRCYACARKQDPRREACEKCGASFVGLCACGSLRSLFATGCTGCGARLGPRRLPRGKHPAVRAARWTVLACAVATAALVFWSRGDEVPDWALKDRAFASYREGRFADAARDYKDLTERKPRDAEAWVNLALCYRNLSMQPEACLDAARRAVELRPTMYQAVLLLAMLEREVGSFAESLVHARAAAALEGAGPEAALLVAQLLVGGPDPDIHAAIESLRAAAAKGKPPVEATILLAECYLWIYGTLAPDAYPPEAVVAMRDALEALPSFLAAGGQRPDATSVIGQARILLACGKSMDAWALTDRILTDSEAPLPPDVRTPLLVLRGRAMMDEWPGRHSEAATNFLEALALQPSRSTCRSIVLPLGARGRLDFAADLLAQASAGADPDGAISCALAQVQLERGKVAEAAAAIETARARNAADPDPTILLVLGDVRAAQGDLVGAKAAFDEAGAGARGWTAPKVRRALLELSAKGTAAERTAALAAAATELEALTTRRNPDVAALRALARIELARGAADRAISAATRAAEISPGDPSAWLVLAEARLADASPDAALGAARALQRARLLRPDDESIASAEIEALMRAGDPAAAVAAAGRFLFVHVNSTRVLRLRARAHSQLARWSDAAADLNRILTQGPFDADVALDAAEAELRAARPNAAREILDRIDLVARPEFTDLVAVLRLRIQGLSAREVVETLRAKGPSSVLARALLAGARFADARAVASELLAKTPGDPDATDVLVHAICEGEPTDEALAAASRAVDVLGAESPDWLAPVLTARIRLARQDWKGAYDAVSPFRDRLPSRAVPAFVFGAAAFRAGHVDEGLGWVRKSLAYPGAPAGLERAAATLFAEASIRETDVQRAERFGRQAIELDADNVAAAIRVCDLLASRGEFEPAVTFAERALSSPRSTREQLLALRLRAAAVLVALGKPALAGVHVDEAAKLDPESGLLHVIRASTALASGDGERAETEIAEARRRMPGSPVAEMQSIAVDLARLGPSAALARAEIWLAAHPGDAAVTTYATGLLVRDGHMDAAVRLMQSMRSARPDDARTAEVLVTLLTRAGRFDDAMAAGRSFADARGPKDVDALLIESRAAVVRASTAPRALELAREVRSRADASQRSIVVAWALEAHAQLRLGALVAADDAARQGLAAMAQTGSRGADVERPLRQAVGQAALASRDFARAADAFRRCVEIAPADADDRNNLAWSLSHVSGSGDQALEQARRATELRPSEANFWSTRAVAALAAEDEVDAEMSFRRCLTRHEADPASDPDGRATAAIRFAEFLARKGRADDARVEARRVASWTPRPRAELVERAASLAGP